MHMKLGLHFVNADTLFKKNQSEIKIFIDLLALTINAI